MTTQLAHIWVLSNQLLSCSPPIAAATGWEIRPKLSGAATKQPPTQRRLYCTNTVYLEYKAQTLYETTKRQSYKMY